MLNTSYSDIVWQINGVISNINMFISPILIRKIYNGYIKSQPDSLISTPSYSILLALTWVLSTVSTCFMFYDYASKAPVYIICIGAIGIVLIAMVVSCGYMVFGVSIQTLNNRIESEMKKGQSVESLGLLVKNYQKLVSVMEPYLFLAYTIPVCNLILMIYIVSRSLASCSQQNIVSVILCSTYEIPF